MAYQREGINAHVRELIDKQIRSSFTLFNPLFYFLGMSKPDSKNKLGRPVTSGMFGGARMGTAQRKTTIGSHGHHFRYIKAEPDDGAAVASGGATPVATSNADENFGTVETRWTHIMEPISLNKHSLEAAKGNLAVDTIVEDSMAPVWERFVKRINQGFWTGTLTETQQNANIWADFLGLQHTTTLSNFYGRVNRATETTLDPFYLDAATQLPSTVIDLNMIRKVNGGFTDELSAVKTGLAGKSKPIVGSPRRRCGRNWRVRLMVYSRFISTVFRIPHLAGSLTRLSTTTTCISRLTHIALLAKCTA